MKLSWVGILFFSLGFYACVDALSTADFNSLHDSQQLTLLIYNTTDAGPTRAEARAAFCANDAVLRRNDAGVVDSKGAIVCKVVKP